MIGRVFILFWNTTRAKRKSVFYFNVAFTMVKWAIHMFINRIIMAGWLLPSTLWGKVSQTLFTISNQRDLVHAWAKLFAYDNFDQGGLLRKGLSSESSFGIIRSARLVKCGEGGDCLSCKN